MLICKVIGHVWATKKEESLTGAKLMVVREETTNLKNGATFVAADVVGAGVGEQVLVVSGSTARRALGRDNVAVDCAIIGIIDTLEVERENSADLIANVQSQKTTAKKKSKASDIQIDQEEMPLEEKKSTPVQYRVDDIIKLDNNENT